MTKCPDHSTSISTPSVFFLLPLNPLPCGTPLYARQVHGFIPKIGNPLFGLSARVIVKDHLNTATGHEAEVWLDTNGMIGSERVGGERSLHRECLATPSTRPPRSVAEGLHPDSVHIGDGEWHMLTLTTFSGGSPGFAIFLDGVLKGVINSFSTTRSNEINATAAAIMVGGPL